ncbi:MAG: M12 family metallo-peptidase, partial [Planctomycetota bacterium]|nr:M12 family metallo-peptidase [Planctomycetota bacterium]
MLLCSLILSFGAQQAQVQLDLPVGLPSQFSTQVVLDDRQVHLDLQRRSLRADNFVIQNSAGENLAIPPSKTYFGVVREMPEIAVVASLEGDGLRASLFGADGDLIRVSPNLQRGGKWHQIKKAEQPPLDMCASEQLPHDLEADGSNQRATSTPPPSAGGHYLSPHPWQWKMRISRIGFDSTYDHWQREGQTVAGVTASVEYQLAENDLVCSRDAMVSYELTGIVIRQTPYYVGTTSGALLSEFASEWANNQQHIPYESAVLLADYQNDGIAGLAYVGTLGSWGYAGLFWDRGYSPGIIAHEIGHNWGCGHIDCWPWGGSAMCGSWLLYGPESTDIIQWRANQYLQLPVIDPYATPVRPYANPDWVEATIRSDNYFDVLANDYDANFDYLSISSVDQFSQQGASIEIVGGGPGGRDRLLYRPDPTKTGEYSDEFWYTTSDFGGLTHDTPVTVSVRDNHLVAAYKFEDNAGSEFSDSSGNGLTITAIPPEMYTDTQDPAIGNQCQNRQWEGSSNFFDNDYGSVFSSDDQGVVSATLTTDVYDGTWLELDYGASTTFNALRHLDVDSSRRWTSKSRLYFSDDHIFDLNDISIDIDHHSHGQNVTYPFDEINARFVRWEIIEQFDATSTQHSLGGKEFSLLRDTRMVPLNPPTISLSSNAKTNFDVGNLIDGDNNTSFLSDGQGAVSSSLTTDPLNGTWVEFNFHAPTLIKGVSILDQTNSAAFTEQSRLWFSDTHTFSPADFNAHLSHHNQAELQVFDFSPTNSQYARWEIHDTAFSFIRDNGLREITFFGDIASNPPFSWQSGAFGGFIEIDEKVSAKKNLDSLSRFTISGRIRPAGVIADNTLLFGLGDPDEDDSRYFKVINNSLHFGGYDLGVSLTANSWHMLSASYDGSQLAVYHDGALVASHQPAYSSQVSELRMAPVTVAFPDANYHGGLDEVFVFNYGLSQHSISDLYTGGSALNPSPRDMSRNVGLNPQLSWTAGLNAVAHDIYFGDDYLEVRDGDANSPSFMTRQSQSNYALQ